MLTDLPDYAFVIVRGPAANPHYRAVKLDSRSGAMRSLVFDGEDAVNFTTYNEARKVAENYNEGPGDDVRSATWQTEKDNWGWEVTSVRHRRSGHRGEDFHSDI